MMNPDRQLAKDTIKIMAHIDPMNSKSTYMRLKNIKAYIRANLEGQKLLQRVQPKRKAQVKEAEGLETSGFQTTLNSLPDLLEIVHLNPGSASKINHS
mmetsp:Transcript_8101/g.13609  ORF Transcript_8101/g.13609 Transcript_8101/m.13609 type:complete len:98 (+) Transcript_8101:84-377(+)